MFQPGRPARVTASALGAPIRQKEHHGQPSWFCERSNADQHRDDQGAAGSQEAGPGEHDGSQRVVAHEERGHRGRAGIHEVVPREPDDERPVLWHLDDERWVGAEVVADQDDRAEGDEETRGEPELAAIAAKGARR